MTKEIIRIKDGLHRVSIGDLSVKIDNKKNRQDEIGQMLQHTNLALSKLRDIIIGSLTTSQDVEGAGINVKNISSSVTVASNQISSAIEGVANDATNQASAINTVTSAVQDMKNNTDSISSNIRRIGYSSSELKENSGKMKQHMLVMQKSSERNTNRSGNNDRADTRYCGKDLRNQCHNR